MPLGNGIGVGITDLGKKRRKFFVNFSSFSVGAYANPGGLTNIRASKAGIPNGANIFLIDGANNNEGRIALIGSDKGLLVEPATTNFFIGPRTSASWTAGSISPAGSTVETSGIDISGATYAKLQVHDVLSGGYGKFPTMTGLTVGANYSVSLAVKAGVTSELQMSNYSNPQTILNGVLSTSWQFFSRTLVQGSLTSLSCCPADGRNMFAFGGETARDRKYTTDCHQAETIPPSTFIGTSRAGDRHTYPGASIVSNGRVKSVYYFKPLVSAATALLFGLGDMYFWAEDVNNYAKIIIGGANHRKIKVCVAGTSEILPTALPDWARLDSLKVYVSTGNGFATAWYEFNGGARTSLGSGSVAMDPIFVGGASLDLFCLGSTNQLWALYLSAEFLV